MNAYRINKLRLNQKKTKTQYLVIKTKTIQLKVRNHYNVSGVYKIRFYSIRHVYRINVIIHNRISFFCNYVNGRIDAVDVFRTYNKTTC